jgi:PAS domain S-box-containing protein
MSPVSVPLPADLDIDDLYDCAPVGYLTTELDGTVRSVNRRLLEWTGFSAEQLIGRKWSEMLLTHAGRVLADTHIEPLLRLQQAARGISLECLCADGRRIGILLYVLAKRPAHGEPFLWMTLVEATDRQNYERRLLEAKRQAEEASESLREMTADLELRVQQRTAALQTANEQLDAFSYAVSHDLRAPLRVMAGLVAALREDYANQLGPEALGLLARTGQSASQMSNLIDGLLDLSHATRSPLELQIVDLTQAATAILEDLSRAEPGRSVDWSVQPALQVRADPRMLNSVLHNLLGNAWKYTAKTANATIRVYTKSELGRNIVHIEDNGSGFDASAAKSVFRPFARFHAAHEFPGTGIGLSIVQRILERHGGSIDVASAPGRGATFRFWLPADAKAPEAPAS